MDGHDVDKKLAIIATLENELRSASGIDNPDETTSTLNAALHDPHQRLSQAALVCLPLYFPLLAVEASSKPSSDQVTVPGSSPQSSPRTSFKQYLHHHQHKATYNLRHAFISGLLPVHQLSDSKEKIRELARGAFISAARTAFQLQQSTAKSNHIAVDRDKETPWMLVSRAMQEFGFHSKNSKAREQSLLYLHALRCPSNSTVTTPSSPSTSTGHPTQAINTPPLKPFTPLLLPLLSDPDPLVRSTALSVTIRIFTQNGITSAAKADLKKELEKVGVQKKVMDTILSSVLGQGGAGSDTLQEQVQQPANSLEANGSPSTSKATVSSPSASSTVPSRKPITGADLVAALPAAAFASSSAINPTTEVHPVYIASKKDLEREFSSMRKDEKSGKESGCFDGKETEFNWLERDKAIAKIRGMLMEGSVTKTTGKGQEGEDDLKDKFLAELRTVEQGILKTASSLRTTVAISALTLISELALGFGGSTAFDHGFLEIFLSHCLNMAGSTKKIVATASQSAVKDLITHHGHHYHHKCLQLLWQGMNDKIVLARTFVSSHLGTFVKVHGESDKEIIKHSGGLEFICHSLRKGLIDPNTIVKDNCRDCYWESWKVWPDVLEKEVLESLPFGSIGRKQLENARPPSLGGGKAGASTSGVNRSLPAGTGKPASSRPSVRELMAAKKRAAKVEGEAQDTFLPDDKPVLGQTRPTVPLASSTSEVTKSPTNGGSHIRRPSLSTGRRTSIPGPVSPSSSHSRLERQRSINSGNHGRKSQESISNNTDILMNFASPFKTDALHQQEDSSEDFKRLSSDLTHINRTVGNGTAKMVLPETEQIVDEALKEQAEQAEQAAERLLELTEAESDDATVPRTLSTSGVTVTPNANHARGPSGRGKIHYTPLPGMAVGRLQQHSQQDIFQDSPDLKDAAFTGIMPGSKNWWMTKGNNDTSVNPRATISSSEAKEVSTLISALSMGQIDRLGLQKLASISRERFVPESVGVDFSDNENNDVDVLSSPTFKRSTHPEQSSSSAQFWEEDRHFERTYEGLTSLLLKREKDRDVALLLLKNLVQYQFACFAGQEGSLFDLLFHLREDPSRNNVAGVEAIADLACGLIEPLYGLGTLNSSLTTYLTGSTSHSYASTKVKSYALGLTLMGTLFKKLPAEILEDEVPKVKHHLKKGINDPHSGEVRRAAVMTLVAAQAVLKDEQRLCAMVDGLAEDQRNLLAYYVSKIESSPSPLLSHEAV